MIGVLYVNTGEKIERDLYLCPVTAILGVYIHQDLNAGRYKQDKGIKHKAAKEQPRAKY